jgi:predicted phage terminase large subunit-like protein
VLYGGAAGGGKSEALLMAPLRWVTIPSFQAILFRRTFKELEKSLIPRSQKHYRALGGRYNENKACWHFPSGARIWFGHLQHPKDVHDHQSAEYQYVGFDELTTFEESQFRYMLSRARRTVDNPAPIRIRAGTNPDVNWVRDRFAPWVRRGPDYDGSRVPSGAILWYLTQADGTETYVPAGTPGAISRSFIRADHKDTPQLDQAYIEQLKALDPVQRARLLEGDWDALPAAGSYFKRRWVQIVDVVPHNAVRVRFWDRAGTEEKARKGKGPDWTVGVRMAFDGELWYVEHVERFRGSPFEVEKQIKRTAQQEPNVLVRFPQDPGQAGKHQARASIRGLHGHDVRAVLETGSKVVRFGPFSAQAEAGNVRVKRAAWNDSYFQELEGFPTWPFDDQADASSGAFFCLSTLRPMRAGVAAPPPNRGFRALG